MKRLSILLVDDNPLLTSLLTEFLQQQPWLEVLRDGADQLPLSQDPHVLLFNLHVPIWEGLERIAQLRGLYPESGIIALVPEPATHYAAAALAAGADSFVARTTVTSELLPRLHRWSQAATQEQSATRPHRALLQASANRGNELE